jgi:hypothetical protein
MFDSKLVYHLDRKKFAYVIAVRAQQFIIFCRVGTAHQLDLELDNFQYRLIISIVINISY